MDCSHAATGLRTDHVHTAPMATPRGYREPRRAMVKMSHDVSKPRDPRDGGARALEIESAATAFDKFLISRWSTSRQDKYQSTMTRRAKIEPCFTSAARGYSGAHAIESLAPSHHPRRRHEDAHSACAALQLLTHTITRGAMNGLTIQRRCRDPRLSSSITWQ